MASSAQQLQNFVAGGFRKAESDSWIDDLNPSDSSDVIARVPQGSADDARAAARAAAPTRVARGAG